MKVSVYLLLPRGRVSIRWASRGQSAKVPERDPTIAVAIHGLECVAGHLAGYVGRVRAAGVAELIQRDVPPPLCIDGVELRPRRVAVRLVFAPIRYPIHERLSRDRQRCLGAVATVVQLHPRLLRCCSAQLVLPKDGCELLDAWLHAEDGREGEVIRPAPDAARALGVVLVEDVACRKAQLAG